MRFTRRALAISAFLTTVPATVASADENVWTSHGPTDVGWINDLTVSDSAAYAATLNGVFRSDDGGVIWREAGLAGKWIFQIAARPGAPAVFAVDQGFAATPANLFLSRDSGQTWTPVSPPSSVTVVGIDPERLSTVYAGTSDAAFWKSTDSGESWQRVSTIPDNNSPRALAFDSHAIYLLTYRGLFKSLDGGVSWTLAQPPLGVPTSVATGAAAGAVYAAEAGRLCRSTDSAVTWTCATGSAPGYVSRILGVPGDNPTAPPRILASSTEGVFLSDDVGATWTWAGDVGSANLPAIASDASGSLVLAGTDTQIFRSQDRGNGWIPSRAGLKSIWISALALDPRDSSTIWAGGLGNSFPSGPGLFRSADSGLSWSAAGGPESSSGINAIAIDPEHPSTLYAGWGTIFRTGDGGQTWTTSSLPENSEGLHVLASDPGSPSRVWAGSGGLFRSDDGARTWAAAPIAQSVYCLLFDDRHPGTIYAGSYWDVDMSYYPQVSGGSIFVSHDAGATFTKGSFEFGAPVLSIAADPFLDGVLYAAAGTEGILRSADGGSNWESASSGLPDTSGFGNLYSTVLQVLADPIRPGRLYCATVDGVFRTLDGARSWLPFSQGLTTAWTAALAISPDGGKLYAGTVGGGVFELDLTSDDVPVSPCVPSSTRLCLLGNRYAVDLLAARWGDSQYTSGAAQPLGDRAGYFGLPFATRDPDLPEIIVKMLPEGTFGSGGAPVFYSSLTTLSYYLIVTDTITGQQRSYANDVGRPLCGGADIPFGTADASMLPPAGPAAAGETALPLLGRFSVTLEARDTRSGRTANGVAMTSGDRFGFFSLPDFTGDAQFPEVVVKMIDARALSGKFWFFYTGLTSLDYTLTVTDSVTGAVRTYASQGQFCGGADTQAFAN